MRMVSMIGVIIFTGVWIATAAAAAEKGDAAKGEAIFAKSCASCHGKTGKGDGAAAAALNPKPKDLSDKAYVAKLEDKYLFEIIQKGGAAVGKSPLMPPWKSLSDGDIWNVIAYIRSLGK